MTDINKLRHQKFLERFGTTPSVLLDTYNGVDMSLLPPCRDSLRMHVKRANFQALVWNDADKANAFILARAGYDVWMGNNRGNKYSMGHMSKSNTDHDFWDYYQEDMGLKDLPTIIDFVHNVSTYVRFSIFIR